MVTTSKKDGKPCKSKRRANLVIRGLGVGLSRLDYLVKTTGNDKVILMEDIQQDIPDSGIDMISGVR